MFEPNGSGETSLMMTIMGFPGTFCDIGGTMLLEGTNTSAEITARAVCYRGDIIQTGILIGASKNS